MHPVPSRTGRSRTLATACTGSGGASKLAHAARLFPEGCEASNDGGSPGAALTTLAHAKLRAGQPEAALGALDRAAPRVERAGLVVSRANGLCFRALALARCGLDGVREAAAEAEAFLGAHPSVDSEEARIALAEALGTG